MIISFGKKLCDVCSGAVRQREKRREEREGVRGDKLACCGKKGRLSTLLMKGRKNEGGTEREVEYILWNTGTLYNTRTDNNNIRTQGGMD